MTYPDLCVAAALNEFFIPVQVNVDEQRDQVKRFQVIWTPNINVLDPSGSLVYHIEGWLPPPEYSAMLMTAHGNFFLRRKSYRDAESIFYRTWEKFPTSIFAPEALYYRAVARYLESHKPDDLMEGWRFLQSRYPRSQWAIRSSIS